MFVFIYAVINNTINHDRSKGATVVIVIVVGGFLFCFFKCDASSHGKVFCHVLKDILFFCHLSSLLAGLCPR